MSPDQWQYWDADQGNWWSSRAIDCGAFTLAAGGGGPPFTTPLEVGENCAGSVVLGIGVNVGSSNPNYVTAVDGVVFTAGADRFEFDFGPK